MKTSIRLAAVVIAALTSGAHTHVLFPFSRQTSRHGSTQRHHSQSGDRGSDIRLFASDAAYVVNVTVGTPPQSLSMGLTLSDAASWVPDATRCSSRYGYSYSYYDDTSVTCAGHAFKANVSSTLVRELESYESSYGYNHNRNKSFSVNYLGGAHASGTSVRDVIGLPGGVQVSNFTLGLADSMYIPAGVLSLGFNDSAYYSYTKPVAPTFVDRLLADGQVNSKAFSMWLDNEDATTGSLLLGAVNKAAFEPPLVRFRIEQQTRQNTYITTTKAFSVFISSFNTSTTDDGALTPIQNKTELPYVTIDPTFTVSRLPQDIAENLWSMAGATYHSDYKFATIPCSQRDKVKGRVAIQFSTVYGPNLTAPLSDLVLPVDTGDSDKADATTAICLFAVQNVTAESAKDYTIGAPFLKRSYLVFDMASKEVAMAPVKFGASRTEGDIVAFPSYDANIPESTSDRCLEPGTYYSSSYNCSYHRHSHGGSGGSGNGRSLLSRGDIIGLIVGMSIFGLILLVIAIWGIVTCARDNQRLKPENLYSGKTTIPMGEGGGDFGHATNHPIAAPAHLPSTVPATAPAPSSIPEVSQPEPSRAS